MTCSEFVEGFSDFYDRTASDEWIRRAEEHLERCPRCRRYDHVVRSGTEVLRALPHPRVRPDLLPRLRHRIYRLSEDEAFRHQSGSGASALAIVGTALFLTALAWSPVVHRPQTRVALEPIVVSEPPPARRSLPRGRSSFARPVGVGRLQRPASRLWDDAHLLLFEYSPLHRRYSQSSPLRRSGLQQDR